MDSMIINTQPKYSETQKNKQFNFALRAYDILRYAIKIKA